MAQRSVFIVVPLSHCSEKLYKDIEFELRKNANNITDKNVHITVPYSQSFKRKENLLTEIPEMFATMFVLVMQLEYQGNL